jgi:carbonic anhydrase
MRPSATTRGLSAVTALLAVLGACAGAAHTTPVADAPGSAHTASSSHDAHGSGLTPAEARERLEAGNLRFVSGHLQHPHQDPDARSALAGGQQPFALILGCSDSRVGPELVYDQGLGDLFVVRVAGNVVNDQNLGSIEYAIEHLHVPLIVVLGHRRCGAIEAAREVVTSHGHAEGHLQSLVDALRPAVEATAGQDAESTCQANVREIVAALRASEPVLASRIQGGAVAVIGAYYDLETGAVSVLDD